MVSTLKTGLCCENKIRSEGRDWVGVLLRTGNSAIRPVDSAGLAAIIALIGRSVTDGLTTGVLAVDRAGAERAIGEDDTIGELDTRKAGGEEFALPVGALSAAAGVGDIGCSVDGVADTTVVGDDAATAGGTDEPLAVVVGFGTSAAHPVARGLATEAGPWLVCALGSEAKAELRNAVIRSYIRLGLVAAGLEEVLLAVAAG